MPHKHLFEYFSILCIELVECSSLTFEQPIQELPDSKTVIDTCPPRFTCYNIKIAFISPDRHCESVQRADMNILGENVTAYAILLNTTPYLTAHGYYNLHLRACN